MARRRMSVGIGLILVTGLSWSAAMLRGQGAAAPATGSSLQDLAEQKVAIAKKALGYLDNQISAGMIGGQESQALRSQWNRRLFDSEVAAAREPSAKLTAAQQYLESCRRAMDVAKVMAQTGQITAIGLTQREYEVADAEYILTELKSR